MRTHLHRGAASRPAPRAVLLGLALLAWAGCKSEDQAPKAEPAPAPAPSLAEAVAAALPSIHEALPDGLGDAIRFKSAELEEGDLVAAVPAGWEAGAIPWSLRPPEDAELGFHTRYGAGFSCAGSCEAKDWEAALAESEFAQYLSSDAFEVVRDERIDTGGRLVVAERGETVYLAVAWWRPGATRYAFCRATLDAPAAPAAEAFEKACLATQFKL